jgi:hypothetical protein
MIDIAREIESTQREVGEDRTADGATVRSVRLQRDLDAPIEEVWDAFTSPERIGRWFLPISDHRVGAATSSRATPAARSRVRPAAPVEGLVGHGRDVERLSEVEVRLSAVDPETTRFARAQRDCARGDVGRVRPGRRRRRLGRRAAGGLALHLRGGSVGGDGEGRGSSRTRAARLRAEQRGLGRGEPRPG